MHVSRFLSTRCCWSSRRLGSNVVRCQSGAAKVMTSSALKGATGGPPGWDLGGIALVVGAVGIANVLVIAVLEGRRDRRGEIGVRAPWGDAAPGRAAVCAAFGSAARVGGGSWRVEQDQAVDHLVHQAVLPELAGMGQALQSLAKAASERIRNGSSPSTTRSFAAVSGRTPTASRIKGSHLCGQLVEAAIGFGALKPVVGEGVPCVDG